MAFAQLDVWLYPSSDILLSMTGSKCDIDIKKEAKEAEEGINHILNLVESGLLHCLKHA